MVIDADVTTHGKASLPAERGAGVALRPGSSCGDPGGRCEPSANGGGRASDASCPLRSSCCPHGSRRQRGGRGRAGRARVPRGAARGRLEGTRRWAEDTGQEGVMSPRPRHPRWAEVFLMPEELGKWMKRQRVTLEPDARLACHLAAR